MPHGNGDVVQTQESKRLHKGIVFLPIKGRVRNIGEVRKGAGDLHLLFTRAQLPGQGSQLFRFIADPVQARVDLDLPFCFFPEPRGRVRQSRDKADMPAGKRKLRLYGGAKLKRQGPAHDEDLSVDPGLAQLQALAHMRHGEGSDRGIFTNCPRHRNKAQPVGVILQNRDEPGILSESCQYGPYIFAQERPVYEQIRIVIGYIHFNIHFSVLLSHGACASGILRIKL